MAFRYFPRFENRGYSNTSLFEVSKLQINISNPYLLNCIEGGLRPTGNNKLTHYPHTSHILTFSRSYVLTFLRSYVLKKKAKL